jgi:shikimate kinase
VTISPLFSWQILLNLSARNTPDTTLLNSQLIFTMTRHMTSSLSLRRGIYQIASSRPIVLVGMMGSGKTALGNRLATLLSVDFVDSDSVIEQQAGLSIKDIFDIGGEAKFRELELRVITELVTTPNLIIATGGGAFCQPAIQAAVKSHATSLWLDADPEILLARIGNTDSRPLLASGDPLAILSQLASERRADYANADISVRTGLVSHNKALETVVTALIDAQIINAAGDPS